MHPCHCSCSTQSEIVVPVVHQASGQLLAVLDVDSDDAAAFDSTDQQYLEELCSFLGSKEWSTGVP